MASRATISVGQTQVGDEGFCPVATVYLAPSSPRGQDGHDVATTSRFLLPDSDLWSEPSELAKVHVRRMEDGYAIRLPPGEVVTRYLPRPVPGSFLVIATE